ncbi:exonuclease subunit SbcD, partial [Parolsenella catena]
MRLLHIADLHIGKRVCEFSMLEDQRHVLSQVVGLVSERGVDVVLVAGDLYDKSMPSAEAVALVDWFLESLAATGTQAVVIPGN